MDEITTSQQQQPEPQQQQEYTRIPYYRDDERREQLCRFRCGAIIEVIYAELPPLRTKKTHTYRTQYPQQADTSLHQ